MEYIKAITIVMFAYWTCGIIGALISENVTHNEDDFVKAWAFGLAYPVAWILSYPIRAWHSYDAMKAHYEKAGITWPQYLFGRRYKASAMNPIARRIWKGVEDNE